jgi:pilus assembly protein CpaD
MSNMKDVLRVVSLAAVLLAGSCAAPINDGTGLSADGATNHPISVEPSYQTLKLPFSVAAAGLMPDDASRFEAFVTGYLNTGNGAISISAPAGPDSASAIGYFGERLAAMGVPRERILVGTRDAAGSDTAVELGYIGYAAHTGKCGDWSTSLADTSANGTAPNFGCAVQQNVAAQVTDPRDLVSPHSQGDVDAVRRATVIGNYEKGQPTAAAKTQDQSGAVSDVNKQ